MRRSTTSAARAALLPDASRDPIGIVIADGGPGDRAPRFSAFVWGPVPDDALDEATDEEAPFASASTPPLEAVHDTLVLA